MAIPNEAMRKEAERGLAWRKEFGRGGTEVGVARARDIKNGVDLSDETIVRMNSYFARHEVDKEAEGFRPGEDGYPSAGRIAWALWSGDAGQTWAKRLVEKMKKEESDRFFSGLSVLFPFDRANSASMSDAAVASFFNDYIVTIDGVTFSALLESMGDKVRIHPSAKILAASDWLKMAGIDARSVAAKVIEMKPIGDFSFDDFIAKSVRGNKFLLASNPAQDKISITSASFSTFPIPAIVIARAFVDLIPESFYCIHDGLLEINLPNGTTGRTSMQDERPYPNEHAARIKDPAQFDDFRREADAGGEGIDFIYGIKGGESEIQAIRFDKNRYTPAQAKAWLADHDYEPIEFEEATGERMSEEVEIQEPAEGEESMTIDEVKDVIEAAAEESAEDEVILEVEGERLSKNETFHRADALEPEMIDERRVSMALSSEAPVSRSYGIEVLDHSDESINLDFLNSGRAPLLMDHDPERQIGVIESVTLDGSARRLRATVRFGKNGLAKEIYDDVMDGIRGNVSIGYHIDKMVRSESDRNVYRATSWRPMEASIVSIPADQSVGVGRKAEAPKEPQPEISKVEITKMEEMNVDQVRNDAAAARTKEISEILDLAARHNKRDLADKAIREGASVASFRGMLLDHIADKPLETTEIGLTQKEARSYSLMNAIRSASTGRFGGFEAEVSQELTKLYGKEARGFYVPTEIFKRDITTASPTNGSNMISTDHLAGEFIDALRPNLVIAGLGARMMQGLKGDVAIPALNAKTAVGFVAENNAPGSEGAPTFRQVTMSPKTLVQFVDISRKLAMQSDPSVEQVVRDDMMMQFAAKIDEVAIEGGGASEPTGILGTSGIGSVALGTNGGAITYASLVNLEREVAIDNALAGSLAYLTNPKVVAAMRQTARQSSGVEGNFILNDTNTLLGYRVASTSLVPSDLTKGTSSGVCSAAIFGNFNALMIGMFGGLDVLVDPYSNSNTGATRIAMYQDIDVAVRNAESFAAIKDITTA